MKRIKKTLIAGLFACGAFNAQAEVSPFSYGLKAGLSLTPYASFNDDAKINNNKPEHSYLDNPFICGGLYGEYAFNDYVGLRLEAGYLRQGFTLKANNPASASSSTSSTATSGNASTTSESSISMNSHGVEVPLALAIYPLGREEGEGILKVMVGPAFYLPLLTTCKQDESELASLTNSQKKELPSFDIAVNAGLGYEFPFGLHIESKYGWAFMNRFQPNGTSQQTIFSNATNLKEANPHYTALTVGYNLASLFSE